jgi:hypothetical protein
METNVPPDEPATNLRDVYSLTQGRFANDIGYRVIRNELRTGKEAVAISVKVILQNLHCENEENH